MRLRLPQRRLHLPRTSLWLPDPGGRKYTKERRGLWIGRPRSDGWRAAGASEVSNTKWHHCRNASGSGIRSRGDRETGERNRAGPQRISKKGDESAASRNPADHENRRTFVGIGGDVEASMLPELDGLRAVPEPLVEHVSASDQSDPAPQKRRTPARARSSRARFPFSPRETETAPRRETGRPAKYRRNTRLSFIPKIGPGHQSAMGSVRTGAQIGGDVAVVQFKRKPGEYLRKADKVPPLIIPDISRENAGSLR